MQIEGIAINRFSTVLVELWDIVTDTKIFHAALRVKRKKGLIRF